MTKMNGMTRWMASHHFTVNFMHFARQAPKGSVIAKVMARRAARREGLCGEKSMGEYVAEGRGMVKERGCDGRAQVWGGVGEYGKKGIRVMVAESWILIFLRGSKISSNSYGFLLTTTFSMVLESSENSGDVNVLDSLKGI